MGYDVKLHPTVLHPGAQIPRVEGVFFIFLIFYLNIFWDHTQDGPSHKVLSLTIIKQVKSLMSSNIAI